MLRPGTKAAETLLKSECESEWREALEKYDNAICLTSQLKNNQNLIILDKWYREELSTLIVSRTPRHITHDNLQKIMQWKITMGKDRPMLMNLIRQNSPESVTQSSTIAFQKISENDWESAVNALVALRGVGPATASAILATVDPINCPFMADEVLECTTGRKREYTLRAYHNMRSTLVAKAASLPAGWTAEALGRALWSHGITSASRTDKRTSEKGERDSVPDIEHRGLESSARKARAAEHNDNVDSDKSTKRPRRSRV